MSESPVPSVARPLVYSTRWCPDCWRAHRVLKAENVGYDEVNIDHDPDAADLVVRINGGFRSVPTIVFPDGTTLVEPSSAVLRQKLADLRGAGLLV